MPIYFCKKCKDFVMEAQKEKQPHPEQLEQPEMTLDGHGQRSKKRKCGESWQKTSNRGTGGGERRSFNAEACFLIESRSESLGHRLSLFQGPALRMRIRTQQTTSTLAR